VADELTWFGRAVNDHVARLSIPALVIIAASQY